MGRELFCLHSITRTLSFCLCDKVNNQAKARLHFQDSRGLNSVAEEAEMSAGLE
jgi:hypothetical protein